MGCGSSTMGNQGNFYQMQVNQTWDRAMGTLEVKRGQHYEASKLVIRRSGWKTIRVFVSSTFKDFHPEREVLVKKVFPDLRVWCEQRRLNLIECDLRWGVPTDFNVEGTLRACLGEIDRCYQDNVMPFFLNMTSERSGWVPVGEEVPDAIRGEYRWVDGLSVTEMEIMHGAYRNDNPNAIFLLRNPKFLDGVSDPDKVAFVDSNPIAPHKLEILKKMIKDRFPKERVIYYDVDFEGVAEDTGTARLGGLDGQFSTSVFEFFKKRIEKQYPLPEGDLDPYQQIHEQHESFMKNKAESVLGRDAILAQIQEYVTGIGNDVPLLILGGAGSGKSSLMSKVVDVATSAALMGKIPGGGKEGWHVFYHFVGAVPGSTEVEMMLKRLLKEMGVCDDATMPTDLDNASMTVCGALNNPNSRPTIIIVDALNQFDEDRVAQLMSWVPRKLAPHIRCVFSMIPDTAQHKAFSSREPQPQMIPLGPLDKAAKEAIVEEMLGKYNKRLDVNQRESLLGKSSSANPLWLAIACEELRVFGNYKQVTDKINKLPDELIELEMEVLSRFEKENGGELLVAALCLLEVSARGLLEVELLSILADEDNLMPDDKNKDKDSEKKDKGHEKSLASIGKLPAFKWAEVYRALKPYIRPFGDSGEGRLDFYHRSLSKAVRAKYEGRYHRGHETRSSSRTICGACLKPGQSYPGGYFRKPDGTDKEQSYKWWHQKLADFFESCKQLPRKVEEYPVHLIAIKDSERLAEFLCDWEVFDSLFREDFSTRLAYYWRTGSDPEHMETCYMTKVSNMANDPDVDQVDLELRYEKVSRFFSQAGRYAKAKELLKIALKIENEKLGGRKERLIKLYHLSGTILDDELRQENYFDRSQIVSTRQIVDHFEKCCELLKDVEAKEEKTLLGRIRNRLAYQYTCLSQNGGDDQDDEAGALKKAFENVDIAIAIFKDLKDDVNRADSITTKGVCCACKNDASAEEIKCYEEAQSIIRPILGELHFFYIRTIQNSGIYYELTRDFTKAFECFYKWYELSRDLYGADHPSTRPAVESVRDRNYRAVAKKLGVDIPAKHPQSGPQDP